MFNYNFHNINGLYFEVTDCDEDYVCTFIEEKDGERKEHYSTTLGKDTWMKIGIRYIGNFFVEARNSKGSLKHRISFLQHIRGKRVFIAFGSSSLGDTIAWMPYALEFKKKYQCDVIVSTFKNFLFESVYPELEFVEPGAVVNNIVAMPELGWHWDKDKEPVNPITIPLQKSACTILHLPYKEMRPRMLMSHNKQSVNKYICISVKSTSQLKLWDKWQDLIDILIEKGYEVYELSKDEVELNGIINPADTSLEYTMQMLAGCDYYIGLSSGISWLAWAMEVPVVMIANFTEADHEFECIRVENRSVCNGCWNNPKFKFNKGDWNWCPEHEDTPRQFECHKTISVEDVLSKCISSHPNN